MSAAALCLALVIWSTLPSFTHAPTIFETIYEHLEMAEDHGHSHGFEEDLYWAMHGHSHDAADHDHSYAFLLSVPRTEQAAKVSETSMMMASLDGPSRQFRIDRPPPA